MQVNNCESVVRFSMPQFATRSPDYSGPQSLAGKMNYVRRHLLILASIFGLLVLLLVGALSCGLSATYVVNARPGGCWEFGVNYARLYVACRHHGNCPAGLIVDGADYRKLTAGGLSIL